MKRRKKAFYSNKCAALIKNCKKQIFFSLFYLNKMVVASCSAQINPFTILMSPYIINTFINVFQIDHINWLFPHTRLWNPFSNSQITFNRIFSNAEIAATIRVLWVEKM